jgi:ribose transport system substrate-binding protein
MSVPKRSVLRGSRSRITAAGAALLALLAAGCSSASEDAANRPAPATPQDVVLVQSIRSLSNPYHANWAKGGEMFARSVGMPVQTLANEGDSQQQLNQIKSVLSGGSTVVLNVDPNTSSDTQAIVRAVQEAGGHVVTHWNKPDELAPAAVGNGWVAHVSFDGRVGGYETAKALISAMGGSGGIIALQGILDNVPAKQRFAGLERALGENPGVQLLDQQTAEWNRNKAFQVTQTLLAKHSGQVKGIWAANDDMALGALEALRAAGLAGQVPIVGNDAVPEALEAIQAGDSGYVATVSSDAYWQGAAGLALAYKAATGQYDVAAASPGDRAFYGEQFVITKDNVADFLTPPTEADLADDIADPLARNTGALG